MGLPELEKDNPDMDILFNDGTLKDIH